MSEDGRILAQMDFDIAIIGGGIAGLSCAAFAGSGATVAVLEMEPTFGYHATGRSAALYTECYGSQVIRRLAKASKPFLADRDEPMISHRGVLFTAQPNDGRALDALFDEFRPLVANLERLTSSETEELCPLFPSGSVAGGVYEPDACDIDVDALQTTFMRMARSVGTTLINNAPVTRITRTPSGWNLTAGENEITATVVVDAAGAWGDTVATRAGIAPMGLKPLARSVFTFDPGRDPREWPMVVDAHEQWYIKPEGLNMIGSAASEIPTEPSDVRPEEIDVALGIDRINQASNLEIRSVKNTWAGIRTFTPDRVPAVGWARDPQFFWLVGQGGYGIKTSPALGEFAASLLLGHELPAAVVRAGVDPRDLDPSRFVQ
jgi:D-arginine dehydrogenase